MISKRLRCLFAVFPVFGVLFERVKGLCADDVFHAAGIFGGGFGIDTEMNQKFRKQGVPFIHFFGNFGAFIG